MTTMSDNDPKYPLLQNEETGQSAYPPYPPSYGSGGNAANGPTFPQGQFMNQVVHHQPMPMAANQTTVIHSTSVVTTQPAGRIWQAGLCDCCSDCGVCMSLRNVLHFMLHVWIVTSYGRELLLRLLLRRLSFDESEI
ncbi:unnamed protein product [Clavelina lepadiformis]|uniref:Uncharacterized protein n=1 Tax=Clavelina lepadiformis TaxID=159417 RepID=A0ABP0F7A4_CLALP